MSSTYFANALRAVLGLDPLPKTEDNGMGHEDAEERFYVEPRVWPWNDADRISTGG